jgi:lysyl-tRNA synthetase, class II
MSSLEEIRRTRIEKLELLTSKGIDPYPVDTGKNLSIDEALARFDTYIKSGESRVFAGRILSIREQGKIIFLDFDDGTGRMQSLLKSEEPLGEDQFELFKKAFDIGDFIEITGVFFLTKKEERTILATSVRMLAKSLRPLPEKWHGLQDVEERFRKRYLDILSNQEVKTRFIARSRIVTEVRKILDESGYLEVETPALQPLYGGASAEPFVTRHKALDTDLYLRISDELYLKRLLIAGFPKVYEIARDFRNEGIDHTHNPEFTMLEFYEAYSNARMQMIFVEEMIRRIALVMNHEGLIHFGGQNIDFNKPFRVMKYSDIIAENSEINDPFEASTKELKEVANRMAVKVEEGDSQVKILDNIFKKIRPKIIMPTFLIDYPINMLPLTKRKNGEERIVDAFQLYAGGIEIAKAFSELNDPLDQRRRFEREEEVMGSGGKETQPLDEDFIEAMEYGMPPAGGVGIGIDRLTMLMTDASNIKEVILFPTLKPKN